MYYVGREKEADLSYEYRVIRQGSCSHMPVKSNIRSSVAAEQLVACFRILSTNVGLGI